MKKVLIALIAMITLPFFAQAAKYEEGKHYLVVPGQPSNNSEVREYFSYYCPHCRAFEPFLNDIEKNLPPSTKLTKTHVDFMGYAPAEVQLMLSTGLAIAEKTGLAKQYGDEAFNYLQTERKSISDINDVKAIYVAAGGDGATFDKGVKAFAINSQVKRNKKELDKLSQGRFVKSVPTFIVNGKYVINSKELDPKNFVEDYNNIIAYLLTLK